MKSNDLNLVSNLSAGDLASKAWRLYFYNSHKVFNYNILFVLLIILIFTLNGDETNQAPIYYQIVYFLITKPYFTLTIFFFIFLILNGVIIFIFYHSIINNSYLISDYFKAIRYNTTKLLKFWMFIILEIIVILIINIILGLIAALIFYIQDYLHNLIEFMNYLDPLIFLFVLIIGTIVVSSQILILMLQITGIIIDDLPILKAFYRSLEYFFLSFKKSFKFSFYLSSIFLINQFLLYVLLILIIRTSIEIIFPQVLQGNDYDSLFIIIDLLSFSVATLMFWPFLMSGVTVYYYHQKANFEGFDILQFFEKQ